MICTFYSYKGGVGRSMALANVADRLSHNGLKTLIIDFDLEAPGLERYFPVDNHAARENRGLLDLLIAYKQAMSQPMGRSKRDFQKLDDYIYPVYYDLPGSGSLHLLPAGMRAGEEQLSNYAYQLRTFDWQEFYFEWGGALLFQWLAREIGRRYDIALVDSRTGVTEMGGVCAYQLADLLVMFCAPNAQNLQGTREVLRNFNSDRVRAVRKDRGLKVLVAPSRVPRDSPELAKFRNDFSAFEDSVPAALKAMGLSFWDLMVPYDPQFAFEERVAGAMGASSGDAALPQAYDRLAKVIASMAPDGSKASEAAKHMSAPDAVDGGPPGVEIEYDATTSSAGIDVYLSYDQRDHEFVRQLAEVLQKAGLRAFANVERLKTGDSLPILDAIIQQSSAVLLLVRADLGSYQTQELIDAVKYKRRIIVVLLPGASTICQSLLPYEYIDLRSGVTGTPVEALIEAVKGPEKKSSRAAIAEENPYVGMRSFEETESRFFFGRDALTKEALDWLQKHSFLAIIGGSGAGKSALVRAGIIPRLREQNPQMLVTVTTPGSDPVSGLSCDLAGAAGFDPAGTTPADVVARVAQRHQRLAIVVDELEEVWTLQDSRERIAYLRLLASLAQNPPEVIAIVVLLRADCEARTNDVSEFGKLVSSNQLVVQSMTPDQLRQAIQQPAYSSGVTFEAGLVDRILDDLKKSDSPLPLLQILLERLWADRRRGFITHASYEACGGFKILSLMAEKAFESSPDQKAARTALLKLVSSQGARVTVPLQSFSDSERGVVETFVQARLLRTSARESLSYVELAYEPLVHEWDRLASWINKERDALEERARLQADVDASNRGLKYLYRGERLAVARRWLRENRELATPEQIEFIEKSRRESLKRWVVNVAIAAFILATLLEILRRHQLAWAGLDSYDEQEKVIADLSPLQRGIMVDKNGTAFLVSGLIGSKHQIATDSVWSANGTTVAGVSNQKIVILNRHGDTLSTIDQPGKQPTLALSGDGHELAAGVADGKVRIWSLPDSRVIATLDPHLGPVKDLEYSGSGLWVNNTKIQITGSPR